jgi:hypothetical protein
MRYQIRRNQDMSDISQMELVVRQTLSDLYLFHFLFWMQNRVFFHSFASTGNEKGKRLKFRQKPVAGRRQSAQTNGNPNK